MTALALASVTRSFGSVPVLAGVDLAVVDGEVMVLLGPSGGGKTTLLRLVAGIDAPDGGTITLGDRIVAGGGVHVPPEDRGVGLVFQDGALFTHLTVAENVGFGLPRGRRRSSPRIEELLELVGLAGTGRRRPDELSGGQRQRVALARALAPAPDVLLLDEPFSNLDAALRAELRRHLREILGRAGTTALFVTHDRTEAFEVGDRIAVLRDGVIVQVDGPEDLYGRPEDPWVAAFVGEASFLDGHLEDHRARTALGALPVRADAGQGTAPSGTAVEVMVRPEQLRLGPPTAGAPGRVASVAFGGATTVLEVDLDASAGPPLVVLVTGPVGWSPGQAVGVTVSGPVVAYGPGPGPAGA